MACSTGATSMQATRKEKKTQWCDVRSFFGTAVGRRNTARVYTSPLPRSTLAGATTKLIIHRHTSTPATQRGSFRFRYRPSDPCRPKSLAARGRHCAAQQECTQSHATIGGGCFKGKQRTTHSVLSSKNNNCYSKRCFVINL
ncbi:uncharacterized protein TM35_000053700 [Trypanosoma theileri]|uniref:Uncharacterized protein n=1 Tax=Trypanosoma theileri TaxID=67003 RepID=A0A1X0P4A5_9TRYP|nr:uncharacterized protein TM35_000053700 [Trypanosoma theileri]ORC91774.1 hypothetical protein TM35_000053700 [Trypanosoma theileri]